jgi:hypothetical protein
MISLVFPPHAVCHGHLIIGQQHSGGEVAQLALEALK